ncbi:glycine zipper domain-containing protein [Altererythrobacter lauratis]|uniref:17 kDa surface antigen n=1 Tax=Alteraurantiacibacter lauratis TaxID=2054627 RepID=A0ABV7EHS7_9SPHN
MPKRLAVYAATTALLGLSAPALAQQVWDGDGYTRVVDRAVRDSADAAEVQSEADAGVSWARDSVPAQVPVYAAPSNAPEEAVEWTRTEVAQPTYRETAMSDGDYRAARAGRDALHHHQGAAHGYPGARSTTPQLAYGPAERAEWLAQCRALRAEDVRPTHYVEEERRNGGLIGGILGAMTGGIVGNRVADGDRLLGTVIGAGMGGVAGAVIGSVIDNADRRRDDGRAAEAAAASQSSAFDYCEAYLLNYERGYGVPVQMAYAPVAMVPVAQYQPQAHRPQMMRHRMIEEEVLVEPAPAPRRQIRRATPTREPGKLIRANKHVDLTGLRARPQMPLPVRRPQIRSSWSSVR